MEIKRKTVLQRLEEYLLELRPRPNTGRFGLDVAFILFILFLQLAILPSLTFGLGIVDLLTPWLAISAVRQKAIPVTCLAMLGAIGLETHGTGPAGLYMAAYWIMVNTIIQVRPTLSWRHRIPWLATFALSALWVSSFESFIISINESLWVLSPVYWFKQLLRVAIATAFGMLLAREWLSINAEEPVPQ